LKTARNHNSIIFLTTLGVYLGLVLAGGAAPQVFAHSATTRGFDISDEIETHEDLDRDPDGDRASVRESVQVYLADVEEFLSALQSLGSKRQFDLGSDSFRVAQGTRLPCVAGNQVGSYGPERFETSNPALEPLLSHFSKRLTDGYSLPDCVADALSKDDGATHSRFDCSLKNGQLNVKVTVQRTSPASAVQLANSLDDAFRQFVTPNETITRQIIRFTTFTPQKDQVTIVTNMPRASLESILSRRS
jgi:hypothetical protein